MSRIILLLMMSTSVWAQRTTPSTIAALSGQTTTPQKPLATSVCEIIHNPAAFAGRIVTVRATVASGLESSTIVDPNDKSCRGPWFEDALKEGEPPRDSRDAGLQSRHQAFLREDENMKRFTEAVQAFVPSKKRAKGPVGATTLQLR